MLYELIILSVYLTVPASHAQHFVYQFLATCAHNGCGTFQTLFWRTSKWSLPEDLCSWLYAARFYTTTALASAPKQHVACSQAEQQSSIVVLTCKPDSLGALFMYAGLLRFLLTQLRRLLLVTLTFSRRTDVSPSHCVIRKRQIPVFFLLSLL